MADRDELTRLRAALYRPDADPGAVERYQRALATAPPERMERPPARSDGAEPGERRRLAGSVKALAVVVVAAAVLAGGAVAALQAVAPPPPPAAEPPELNRGDSTAPEPLVFAGALGAADEQRRALAESPGDPEPIALLIERYPRLVPMRGEPVLVRAGEARDEPFSLAAFPSLVVRGSEVVVLVVCSAGEGRFSVRLSTETPGPRRPLLVPLRTVDGDCAAGPQSFRYRPFRDLVPTAARLTAPSGSTVAVVLTG